MDENFHYDQISRFSQHIYQLNPSLMTLPGYHLFFAYIANLFHNRSIEFIRYISFTFNLVAIAIFYLITITMNKKSAMIKTLQFSFLPILFPFFPLIYTDGFSVLFVLLSFYSAIKKHYSWSGLFSVISLLIRQNNIFWLFFINILLFFQNNDHPFTIQNLISHVRKSWVFVTGIFLLISFLILNNGLVISSYAKSYVHLSWSLTGNFYFLLFILFFLLLPVNLTNFKRIVLLFRRNKLITLISVVSYVFFIFSFTNDHPFNQATWFLRNSLLVYFSKNIITKTIFFLPVLYSFLSLSVTRFENKYYKLIYPFTVIYLLPYWLIEERYYIIPVTLFLLFRQNKSKLIEYSIVGIFLIFSTYLVNGIINGWFFP